MHGNDPPGSNRTLHGAMRVDLGLAGEDCQHAVTDVSLCPVTGCVFGTDVRHWMFKTKVNMVQGQDDGPLIDNEIQEC